MAAWVIAPVAVCGLILIASATTEMAWTLDWYRDALEHRRQAA